MMGGFGSGRPSSSGQTRVEACCSIDVNPAAKVGCLHAGWLAGLQWTSGGEEFTSINLRAEADRLLLSYRLCMDGAWADVEQTVPCRFGGERPYFICPAVVNGGACGRRVAKLHR